MKRAVPVGPEFHEATKYHSGRAFAPGLQMSPAPPVTVFDASLPRVQLPAPQTVDGPGIWTTIAGRRSFRDFTGRPMTIAQLSQLLWAINGITAHHGGFALRACASAGGLYPIDTYLVINAVEDLPRGVAFYEPHEHRLCLLAEGDFSRELVRAALGQDFCATAAVVLVWVAVVARSAWKYSDRAYRYIYMDAGHLGAQGQLAAEALGLGSVNIGAFFDDEVANIVGVDNHQRIVVYMMAVGPR
ncbi:MAG: SagB/ThcOx family dehydrogenase [Armatimonadetes bacterium]|nr:SagB/ThcOx family dehydrogenase [Armatimonadota bacterium]